MKTIKILTTILIVIIIGTLVWAAFLPSKIEIKQQVTIKAPVAVVFDEVNDLRNWDNWSPYKDSSLQSRFEGPVRGVGAKVLWTDKKEGEATLTISEVNQFTFIKTVLKTPSQEKTAETVFTFEQIGDSTKVSWERNIEGLSYPFGRFVGWMLEKGYNYNFSRGLKSMKEYIETYKSEPEYYGFETELKEFPGGNYLAMDDSCLIDDMSYNINRAFDAIRNYAEELGINPSGVPMIEWHSYNPDDYSSYTCMIPYDTTNIATSFTVYFKSLPSYHVAMIRYEGSYDYSYYAWIALDNYRMFHNLRIAGDPIEEYIVGPRNETDSSKFITNIYFPYKGE
jgi:effector-binding domain-containing protein